MEFCVCGFVLLVFFLINLYTYFFFFFFFQAEDGIRDLYVTRVQTCALPICRGLRHAGRPLWHAMDGERRRAGRKSVVSGKSVYLGGRRIIKKKKKKRRK